MKTKVKISMIASAVALLSLGACSRTETASDDLNEDEVVAAYNESRTTVESKSYDSLQVAFAQTLNEIDHNLNLIREKEGSLVLGPESSEEKGISKEEHIKRNISIINSLMEQNKEKLETLTAQLKKSKSQNSLLAKLKKGAEERVTSLESEIAQLKSDLSARSSEVADYSVRMNDAQLAYALLEDKAARLDKQAYQAFYTVGSYDELENEKVLTKEKRALIGKKKALKQDFNTEYFTEVDTREVTKIPLFADKAKLVTFHPKNSFALKEEKDQITYLEIINPEEFWKASKVLVVEVKI